MAIGDELDKLLADDRLLREDWEGIEKVLGIALPTSASERRTLVSKEIRHNYGHSLKNIFREWYEPDYVEIVRATAEKLKIDFSNCKTVSKIEDEILFKVLGLARESFIKEYGLTAWNEIEKEIERDINEKLSQQGFMLPGDVEKLKQARATGFMNTLLAGGLSDVAAYAVLSLSLMSIARFVMLRSGLGVGAMMAPVVAGGAMIAAPVSLLFGPAGWLWAGGLLVFEVGNTNWKKTIPAIVVVASYRRKLGLI